MTATPAQPTKKKLYPDRLWIPTVESLERAHKENRRIIGPEYDEDDEQLTS
jgi:hypothetical protein